MNRIPTSKHPGCLQYPSDTRPGAFPVQLPFRKQRRELEKAVVAKLKEVTE